MNSTLPSTSLSWHPRRNVLPTVPSEAHPNRSRARCSARCPPRPPPPVGSHPLRPPLAERGGAIHPPPAGHLPHLLGSRNAAAARRRSRAPHRRSELRRSSVSPLNHPAGGLAVGVT